MNQRKGQGEGEDIQGGGEQILELDGDWRENGGRGRIILHWERIEFQAKLYSLRSCNYLACLLMQLFPNCIPKSTCTNYRGGVDQATPPLAGP